MTKVTSLRVGRFNAAEARCARFPEMPVAAENQRTRKRSRRALQTKGRRRSRIPGSRYVVVICQIAVLLVIAVQLYRHAFEAGRVIATPFQFDYEEGNILNALVRITHGLSPYPDPHALPNVLNPYGPVAYYLLATALKIFGLSFTGPRLMIAGSLLTISIFSTLLLARMTGSRLTAAVFGSMYATLWIVRDWSALLRVDLLTLALTTAGMYFFSRIPGICVTHPLAREEEDYAEKHTAARPLVASVNAWASAVLLAAGICTKYTALAAPAACVMFLLIRRSRRDALQFAAMGLGICGLVFATWFRLTRGAIVTHLFLSHPDPFMWSGYTDRLAVATWRLAPLVALSLIAVVKQIKDREVSLPALWLILATVSAVTAGKLGSNWNHFLEWPIALCICAGLGWTVLVRIEPASLGALAALVASLGLLGFVAIQEPRRNLLAGVRECPAAYEFIRSQGGDRILSENIGALVLSGKKVWVSNPFVLNQLMEHSGWSDPGIKKMLKERQFSLMVSNWDYASNPTFSQLGVDRFNAETIQSIVGNYHVVAAFRCQDARYMWLPNE